MSSTQTAIRPFVVSRPRERTTTSREKRSVILCLLLVLVTLAFYNPIVHNKFTNLDDDGYITENAQVHEGLTWATVKWAFTSRDAANWHPLTWLSHALDYQLFNLNPVGHHYVNLLLHALNAALLFLLLEAATGLTWPSLMVAALFALHPVNVESVAWAAERKNVLSMFFFLLTLHAYGWYVRRGGVRRYAAVAGLFALGLMAKPEIITLPFVLLLWDYWPLRRMDLGGSSVLSSRFSVLREKAAAAQARSFSYLFLEKVPLLLLSAGSAVVTMVAQSGGNAVRPAALRLRIGNAIVAYVRYIGKAFWPVHLAALYPHPGRFLPVWEIVASAALLVLLTALVLHWRNHGYLVTGWFWFLGTLVPVIGLVQVGVQAMADRYAYLSFIGLFVCIVWGVTELTREWKVPTAAMTVAGFLVLATLGMVTRHQITYWHDSEILWRHTLAVTERNYMAHDALARALAKDGRIEDAIVEHKAAEALHAYSPAEMIEIGLFEQTHGYVEDAIEFYARSLGDSTNSNSRAIALSCLGSAFMQEGDLGRARASYAYALQQNPENGVALVGAGLLAERDGDLAAAVSQMSHAMKVEPTDVGYMLLAQALRRAGSAAEADDAVTRAQHISSNFPQAQQSAARVLATAGIKTD